MSRLRPRLSSVMTRYAVLYFAVIVLIAGGIAVSLLDFTAGRLLDAQTASLTQGLTMAAEDLENQYQVLSDIRAQVSITFCYRPSVLSRSPYQDVVMLEDFVRFRNYSPLVGEYFLMYHGSDKVYTSEGFTSYFPTYAVSTLGMDQDGAESLQIQAAALREDAVLLIGQRVLMLFPIRFVPGDTCSALMGFVLPLSTLEQRMHLVAANVPEMVSLTVKGVPLLTLEEKAAGMRQILYAQSAGGMAAIAAAMTDTKWTVLTQAVSGWLWLGVAALLAMASAVAMGLARLNQRPLRQLIARYISPGDHFENEFVQLDQLMRSMEKENNNSMRLMQNQLLLTILRGYYSESLIDRWRLFHITFDKTLCCVFVLDAACLTEEQSWLCVERINALSGEEMRIYAAHVPDEHLLAVLASFDEGRTAEQVVALLQQALAAYPIECFAGKPVELPQRMSISYMEALTAWQHARRVRADGFATPREFAMQLVSAAERGDEAAARQLCDRLLTQQGSVADVLSRHFAIALTAEIARLAEEKHVAVDQQQLSAACLLPGMEVFLADIRQLVQGAFQRPEDGHQSRVDETAAAIVAYVQGNAFDADFDLSRISDCFGLSNDYVSAMIKRVTGMAFKEYLTELRMAEARRLLRECPEMSVNEISEAAGYRKTSNFIKKFKEKNGCTPLQYR